MGMCSWLSISDKSRHHSQENNSRNNQHERTCHHQNDNHHGDRHIRESVERLRKQGVLICDMGDGVGRYLPETVEEYRAFRAKYSSRAFAIIDTVREMDEAAKSEWSEFEQPRLL